MGINLEFFDNKLNAKISGEIDHHSAADFRQQIDNFINKKKPEEIILDFNEVSFMDTSGIGFIMGRFKTAYNLGIKLKVINIPKKLERLVKLSGIKNLGILE